MTRYLTRTLVAAALACAPAFAIAAEKKYDQGATDTEIRLGQTMPYSGPLSAHGIQGRTEVAYFRKLNEEQGGINGRKVNLISLDDSFSPPKTVEQTRKLVEQDEVLATFASVGTAAQTSVQRYLNQKKIPQLMVSTGASKFNQPKAFPWTTPSSISYVDEAVIYGKYLAKEKPNSKIVVLYLNDDFGKDYLAGIKRGLGDKADKMIVSAQMFQPTDPTVDSQMVILKNAGADALFLFTYAKQAAQAISKAADLNWKPHTFLHLGSASIGATLKPAGLDKSVGVMTAGFAKDPSDPQWKDDPAVKEWLAWMKENMPGADTNDALYAMGFATAQTLEQVLKQAGDDLTRENIMKQVGNLKQFRPELLLPGSYINTSPDNYAVVTYMKLQKFNGKSWDFVD